MFSVHVQRGAARYQDFKIGAQSQQLRHGGCRLNQMLEIIHQEEHWLAQ